MFKKNRRQTITEASTATSTAPRFSLIRALSKLSRSGSSSREAFAIGKEVEKGFISRLFTSSSKAEVKSDAAANPQRKPSFWQRSKSFLQSKKGAEMMIVDDSVSTIDLPRVKKTQLPKLKLKGSGSALKIDFASFVLGAPEVAVDTDALLQRMFELNDQPYQTARAKYVPQATTNIDNEAGYLSPVMTAVTFSELGKESTENEASFLEQRQEQFNQILPISNEPIFNDDPQLDSPLLSVSRTLEDDDSSGVDELVAQEAEVSDDGSSSLASVPSDDNDANTGQVDEEEDAVNADIDETEIGFSIEDQSIADESIEDQSIADESIEDQSIEDQSSESQSVEDSLRSSDWSMALVTEKFGILDVNEPVMHSDGSIHYRFDDSQDSIVFEDWRKTTTVQEDDNNNNNNKQELRAPLQAEKTAKSFDDIPRAVSVQEESSFKTRSMSGSMIASQRRKTLGARISEIVAIFERGIQEELSLS